MKDTINDFCNEILSKCTKEVNYINLINELTDKKISIIAKYLKPYSFYFYGNEEGTNPSEYYYGLSPKYGIKNIEELIKSDVLLNTKKIDKYLFENRHYFMLDSQEEMEMHGKSLFFKTIFGMSLKYGFCLKYNEYMKETLINYINSDVEYKMYANINYDNSSIVIKSHPPIEFIDNFPFAIDLDKECLCDFSASKIKLNDLYSPNCPFLLTAINPYYYSGVLPRLKRIEKRNSTYNTLVESYEFQISRTTFATVEGINDGKILKYAIMNPYKQDMISFLKNEFDLENEYLGEKDNLKSISVETINEYLQKTNNTNIIAVSGNIKTSDDYLLFGLRASDSYDSNTLYCSVNGQSEIFDENVNLYNYSVYENIPTINLGSPRIDFKNEFSRESISELSITDFEQNFKYYGFSILGIRRKDFNPYAERRIHFNILAKHNTFKSINTIRNEWKNSVESFENKNILASNISLIKNKRSYIKSTFLNLIKLITDSKSTILTIATLLAASSINNYFAIWKKEHLSNTTRIIDFVITAITIFYTMYILYRTYRYTIKPLKSISFKTKLIISQNKTYALHKIYDYTLKKLLKKSRKHNKRNDITTSSLFSPIALLMFCLYYNDLIYNTYDSNE